LTASKDGIIGGDNGFKPLRATFSGRCTPPMGGGGQAARVVSNPAQIEIAAKDSN